jgi:lipoyl(octanoyl) transferase
MSDIWRFIDSGPCRAYYNMALDEAVAGAVRADNASPTLRFYEWDVPSVSIGCFQKIGDIDAEYCRQCNIPFVRRPTGGRAILHGDEITYSFSVKTKHGLFSSGLLDSYKKISAAFGKAFLKIGLAPELKLLKDNRHKVSEDMRKSPLCFQSVSYGEMSVMSGKIIGSAQKRWPDGLLQQGSIPFSLDREKTGRVFGIKPASEPNNGLRGLKDIISDLNPGDLKDAIRISFEEIFDVSFVMSTPLREEVSLAHELESLKYSSSHWTFHR